MIPWDFTLAFLALIRDVESLFAILLLTDVSPLRKVPVSKWPVFLLDSLSFPYQLIGIC